MIPSVWVEPSLEPGVVWCTVVSNSGHLKPKHLSGPGGEESSGLARLEPRRQNLGVERTAKSLKVLSLDEVTV